MVTYGSPWKYRQSPSSPRESKQKSVLDLPWSLATKRAMGTVQTYPSRQWTSKRKPLWPNSNQYQARPVEPTSLFEQTRRRNSCYRCKPIKDQCQEWNQSHPHGWPRRLSYWRRWRLVACTRNQSINKRPNQQLPSQRKAAGSYYSSPTSTSRRWTKKCRRRIGHSPRLLTCNQWCKCAPSMKRMSPPPSSWRSMGQPRSPLLGSTHLTASRYRWFHWILRHPSHHSRPWMTRCMK